MLSIFQKANTWRWQSLYEARASYEVKGDATYTEFGSMIFDELWTLNNISLTFNIFFILLSILIAFKNAKAFLNWSIYANLVVI